jgi:hypothetical protein
LRGRWKWRWDEELSNRLGEEAKSKLLRDYHKGERREGWRKAEKGKERRSVEKEGKNKKKGHIRFFKRMKSYSSSSFVKSYYSI